jgi:hypothetical protein
MASLISSTFRRKTACANGMALTDWGLATLTPEQGRDILEIVEDRHNRRRNPQSTTLR